MEGPVVLEKDPISIAVRIAESFESELHAFIYDNRLVDSRVVQKLIALSGYDNYIARFAKGHIIVYYLNPIVVRKKCRYEKCADVEEGKIRECLEKCTIRTLHEIARGLGNSIRDLAKNLEV